MFAHGPHLEWLPLFAVRSANLVAAVGLAWFGLTEFRSKNRVVPKAVLWFQIGWSSLLALIGVWLVLSPITNEPQSALFRAGIGAAFAGSLIGSLWVLLWFHRRPFVCDIHDQVAAEMERRISQSL